MIVTVHDYQQIHYVNVRVSAANVNAKNRVIKARLENKPTYET